MLQNKPDNLKPKLNRLLLEIEDVKHMPDFINGFLDLYSDEELVNISNILTKKRIQRECDYLNNKYR